MFEPCDLSEIFIVYATADRGIFHMSETYIAWIKYLKAEYSWEFVVHWWFMEAVF